MDQYQAQPNSLSQYEKSLNTLKVLYYNEKWPIYNNYELSYQNYYFWMKP